VTVSPFAGESDICPKDSFDPYLSVNIMDTSFALTPGNLYRLYGVLFPPPPEVMSNMCQQGFEDALRFLQRNNKISCIKCVAIQSSFTVAETDKITVDDDNRDQEKKKKASLTRKASSARIPVGVPGGNSTTRPGTLSKTPSRASIKILSRSSSLADFDSEFEVELDHEFDGCEDCERRRETAILDKLPDPVAKAIQQTCDEVNKGVINWLFKHRPVKLLSLLTLPYVLPFDITIVILTKLYRRLPWIKSEAKRSLSSLTNFVMTQLMKMESSRHLYSAQFSCQMSVTEFAYNDSEDTEVITGPVSKTDKTANSVLVRKKSTIRAPLPSDVIDSSRERKTSVISKRHRLERSNTFGGRRKFGVDHSPYQTLPSNLAQQHLHRKSFASSAEYLPLKSDPRKTSCQVVQSPERILSTVNFGFTVDLASSSLGTRSTSSRSLRGSSRNLLSDDFDSLDDGRKVSNNSPPDVIETLKNLSEEAASNKSSLCGEASLSTSVAPVGKQEISALNLANRALSWERETASNDNGRRKSVMGGRRPSTVTRKISTTAVPTNDSGDGFDRILAATSSQDHPLMSFYYMDDKNQVKMTEIFNIQDNQDMTQEELQSRW